jgi:G3E family GTPase
VADLFIRKNAFGRSLADFARLQTLVTVVDVPGWRRAREESGTAVAAAGTKPVFELMLTQVETADVVVLNKCDAATAEETGQVEAMVRGLNPRAEIFRTEQGQLPVEVRREEVEQKAHFFTWTLPVVAREGVQRELLNSRARAVRHDLARRMRPAHMAHPAGTTTLARPPTVAVHDDRNVPGHRGSGHYRPPTRRISASMYV